MAAAAVLIVVLLGGILLPRIKAYLGAADVAAPIPHSGGNGARRGGKGKTSASSPPPICPVCRSPLPKGADLYTKVFRPMNVHDQHCIIFGCPRCYPVPEPGISRRCPVCHAEVARDGHLVARLFNKTAGKKHVTVTGCPKCAKY